MFKGADIFVPRSVKGIKKMYENNLCASRSRCT
jgi:hypothetical protein